MNKTIEQTDEDVFTEDGFTRSINDGEPEETQRFVRKRGGRLYNPNELELFLAEYAYATGGDGTYGRPSFASSAAYLYEIHERGRRAKIVREVYRELLRTELTWKSTAALGRAMRKRMKEAGLV